MALPDVEVEGATIVVLGRFNPAIFSPAWLRLHNLIGAVEASEADVKMIIPPAAVFSTEWLSVDVRHDRMQLGTAMPQEVERLRDTAIGVLSVLPETPISAVGINRDVHWATPSREKYDWFGDELAPKKFWDRHLKLSGTQDLTIRAVRPDNWAGYILVSVQPSTLVKPCGVYAMVNDHALLRKVPSQPRSRADTPPIEAQDTIEPSRDLIPLALEVLRDEWPSRMVQADRVLGSLIHMSRERS